MKPSESSKSSEDSEQSEESAESSTTDGEPLKSYELSFDPATNELICYHEGREIKRAPWDDRPWTSPFEMLGIWDGWMAYRPEVPPDKRYNAQAHAAWMMKNL